MRLQCILKSILPEKALSELHVGHTLLHDHTAALSTSYTKYLVSLGTGPFLLTAKGLVPRLTTKYLVGKLISLFAPGAVDKAAVWSCSSVWPTCNSLKAFSGRILFRMHCKCKATFSLGESGRTTLHYIM